MARTDWELLTKIKQRIEELGGLGNAAEWVQKDYDFLVFFIEERTGTSLSLSTVKRIWRNEYHRLPHISTLDTLAQLALGTDWQTAKANQLDVLPKPIRVGSRKRKFWQSRAKGLSFGLAGLILVLLGFLGLKSVVKNSPPTYDDVAFSLKKTVDGKVPNTVVFEYDIENVNADRFFLQQSWDESRRVEIFKGTKARTDIYYVPGYFTAKLMADDAIIKQIPVHVTHNDWFIAARQPMSNIQTFGKSLWPKAPYLGVDETALHSKGIDTNKDFQLAFYYVKDFGLSGNDFQLKTSFKMKPVEAFSCPSFNIHVQGVDGYYWIRIAHKGCESNLELQFGERFHDGKNEDLSMFGTSVYQWHDVTVSTMNQKVNVQLDGESIFSSSYEKSIGQIMEISYFFYGIGAIDNVDLKNGDGLRVFADDFEVEK